MKRYYVYILSNRSRTLYTGVTNNLERRTQEHRGGRPKSFTEKYRLKKLVYYEFFSDVRQAIGREKQIKGWLRRKKIALIEGNNPEWKDLSSEWRKGRT